MNDHEQPYNDAHSKALKLTAKGLEEYRLGRTPSAIALWEEAVALDPDTKWAKEKLPHAYEEIEDLKVHRDEFLRTLTTEPKDDQPNLRLAETHRLLGEMEEACAIWRRLTSSGDKNAAKFARKMLSRYGPDAIGPG